MNTAPLSNGRLLPIQSCKYVILIHMELTLVNTRKGYSIDQNETCKNRNRSTSDSSPGCVLPPSIRGHRRLRPSFLHLYHAKSVRDTGGGARKATAERVASCYRRLRTKAANRSLLPAIYAAAVQRRIIRLVEPMRPVTLLSYPPQVDDQSMCANGQDYHAPMPWNHVV